MSEAYVSSDIMMGTGQGVDPEKAKQFFDEGQVAEKQLDRWTAIDQYHKAFSLNPDDPEICFRLAYNLDLVGEEEQALNLYEQCCSVELPKLNALVNLAILYEDRGEYIKAEKCLKQVTETNPNNARARLFMKDVQASREMFYDEEQAKLRENQSGMLDIPVTDFELSVRARNCLKKMNINSLGDLLRTTEAELLGYKNFGETSLLEIKSMLAQRGMRLGQSLDTQHETIREEVYEQLRSSGANEDILGKPVEELNLSIRARKALGILNIHTIGDLISHTEAELLGIKNFGLTSLEEVKIQLTELGIGLRRLEH